MTGGRPDADIPARIEPYVPGDAPAVIRLWNSAIGDAFPLTEEVLRQVLERNPSHRPGDAFLARVEGAPAGFAYAGLHRTDDPEMTSHHDRGFLQAVIVDERWRRRGIGRRLAAQVLRPAREQGVNRIEAGGGTFYLWPAVPAELPDALPFLAALGFVAGGTSFDLRGDVSRLDASEARDRLAADGLRVDPAEAEDRRAVLAFLFAEFGGEWWHDTRWFLDEGGDPADLLLLHDLNGGIVGLARIHTPATRPVGPPHFWSGRRPANAGGLGPIGIAALLQGRGLGSALLAVALDRLRQADLTDVVIDSTSLLGFYGRLGFAPWITYRHTSVAAGALP
jgi:GNAT superfamily N-acetyltransferase